MARNQSTKEMYYNPSKNWSLRVDGGPTYLTDFGVSWKNGNRPGTRRRDRTMRRLHYEKFVYRGVFDLGEIVEFENEEGSDDGTDGVEAEDDEYADGVGFDDDADDVEDEDGDYNDDVESEESYGYSKETESEDFYDSTDDLEDEEGYESTNEVSRDDDPDDRDAETEHYVQDDVYDT